MAQNYHFLSAPLDLPAKYGVPLRLMLACILECVLSLLHLHGFHTFVTCVSPALIYPTFHHIFFTMSMGERDHYITQAELLHPYSDPPPLMLSPSSFIDTFLTKLHTQISSPLISEISETPMAVEPTLLSEGIDVTARELANVMDMEVNRFDDPDVFHEAPMIENWEFDVEDTGMNAAGPWTIQFFSVQLPSPMGIRRELNEHPRRRIIIEMSLMIPSAI